MAAQAAVIAALRAVIAALRARVAAAPCAQITVDLREIEEVTDEGCAAIRNVAEAMDFLSQRMVVLYVPERDATR